MWLSYRSGQVGLVIVAEGACEVGQEDEAQVQDWEPIDMRNRVEMQAVQWGANLGLKKSTNEAQEKEQKFVSSIDDLKEDETKNSEEATKSDCNDVEKPESGEKDEEPKELNLEQEISKPNDQVHHQSCTLQGEIQRSDHLNLIPDSRSVTENSNIIHHEAVKIISEPQEDHKMLVEESVETLGLVNSCHVKAENHSVDTKIAQNIKPTVVLNFDDCDLEKNGIKNDMRSEDSSEETLMMNGLGNDDNTSNVNQPLPAVGIDSFSGLEKVDFVNEAISKDERNQIEWEQVKETNEVYEMVNQIKLSQTEGSIVTTQNIEDDKLRVEIHSFSGSEKVDFVNEAKPKDERNQIDWEQLKDSNEVYEMVNQVGISQVEGSIATTQNKEDDKSRVDFDSLSGLEKIDFINEALSKDEQNQIDWKQLKVTNEVCEMVKENGLSQTKSSIATTQNTEEDKSRVVLDSFSGLEKVDFVNEANSKDELNQTDRKQLKYTNDTNGMVKEIGLSEFEVGSQSSSEIQRVLGSNVAQNPETIYSTTEPSKLEDITFKGDENSKKPGTELRKSPSFEFGIPFDVRSEESDQTPLLYQDRTVSRSFSSCSTLRFKDRSVQTEYLGMSLGNEGVEVEEKTIRMERSSSESLKAPSLSVLNNEIKADFVAKAEQENGLKDSPSRGNGKRKPKSSLFTTCICCTAAIS
ncbi:hypothetical protein BUALT_Bualt12G0138000 [Buddleja alternifolia]|uniref:Uncharacterized protein n=1 Tax=Buddleja alternifolia TaxID=168488 RepID=A0AAV6X1W3_9LAMI|nr:hypothetical protein BUALT_Bualt12G0138000 [Buddleja alternifolia]